MSQLWNLSRQSMSQTAKPKKKAVWKLLFTGRRVIFLQIAVLVEFVIGSCLAPRVFLLVLRLSSLHKLDRDRGPAWKPAKADMASSLNTIYLCSFFNSNRTYAIFSDLRRLPELLFGLCLVCFTTFNIGVWFRLAEFLVTLRLLFWNPNSNLAGFLSSVGSWARSYSLSHWLSPPRCGGYRHVLWRIDNIQGVRDNFRWSSNSALSPRFLHLGKHYHCWLFWV